MNFSDFEYAPAYFLPATLALYRIQRHRSRRGGARVGRLRLAPPGILSGRFDLPDDVVGYFGESPQTAGYEAIARREAVSMQLASLAQRELMCFTVGRPLHLLDLRPHAASWPVLQSLRFGVTQQLAAEARASGFEGIIYKSAQQYGMDCLAIFGASLDSLRYEWSERLVEPGSGNLHWLVTDLQRGSQLDVMPPV